MIWDATETQAAINNAVASKASMADVNAAIQAALAAIPAATIPAALPSYARWYTDAPGASRTLATPLTSYLAAALPNPIFLPVPYKGAGRYFLLTLAVATFQSSTDAHIRFGLGVSSGVPQFTFNGKSMGRPCYPFLGVEHGEDDYSSAWFSVPAGQAIKAFTMRMDIVDPSLQTDCPIPGWPNWRIADPTTNIIYEPSFSIAAGVDSGAASMRNVQAIVLGFGNLDPSIAGISW